MKGEKKSVFISLPTASISWMGRDKPTLCVCAEEGRDSNSRSSSATRSSADLLSSNRSSLLVSSSRILCCSLILSDPVPPFTLRNFLFDSSSFSRSRRSHLALYLSISFFMLFTWSWINKEFHSVIISIAEFGSLAPNTCNSSKFVSTRVVSVVAVVSVMSVSAILPASSSEPRDYKNSN